jgi:hypothetical protein
MYVRVWNPIDDHFHKIEILVTTTTKRALSKTWRWKTSIQTPVLKWCIEKQKDPFLL